MNKNLNLVEILKNCPKGTKLYSPIFGEVEFECVNNSCGTIMYKTNTGRIFDVTYEGKFFTNYYDGECTLFPSKDQRDWSKFKAPWYKKDKFDPNKLKPFDKVLVRDDLCSKWCCGFFSHIVIFDGVCKYKVGEILNAMCIPYNDETKHLTGTTDEAPEFYRYWEE